MASTKASKSSSKKTQTKQPKAKDKKTVKPKVSPIKKEAPVLGKKVVEQEQVETLVKPEVPQQVVVSKEQPKKDTMTLQELKDRMTSAPFVPTNPIDRFFKR